MGDMNYLPAGDGTVLRERSGELQGKLIPYSRFPVPYSIRTSGASVIGATGEDASPEPSTVMSRVLLDLEWRRLHVIDHESSDCN